MRFQACAGDGEGDAGGWEKEMLVDPWEGEKEGRRKVFPGQSCLLEEPCVSQKQAWLSICLRRAQPGAGNSPWDV